jgi:hypothetical protein
LVEEWENNMTNYFSVNKSKTLRTSLIGRRLLVGLFFASLAACSTPKPARDFASQGASMTDKAQSESQAFIQRATEAYKRRYAIVRDLSESEIRDTAGGDFRAWIDTQAGALPGTKARLELISRIAERSRVAREALKAALVAKDQELSASSAMAVTVPAKALGDAKKSFLNLAQEMSIEEWLKFSWGYVQKVNADLKALESPATPSN